MSSTSNDHCVAKLLASLQSLSILESDSSCHCGSQVHAPQSLSGCNMGL